MNDLEKKAIELVKQHLPEDTPDIESYQECIRYSYYGFMGYYLAFSRKKETMSTTADYNVTIQLAQIDKSLGTTVPQLVFACCQHCPKKSMIEAIIKLGNKMDMARLAKSIFEFSDKNGTNCLIALFHMMTLYINRTDEFPDSSMPMFVEIESAARCLIKLAEDNDLKMDDILNHTGNDGKTLFYQAAMFSESLANELIKKNVVVTTVNDTFEIPRFRFDSIRQGMIDRGANPHIRSYSDTSQYEFRELEYLSGVSSVQSIYFPIKPFPSGNLPKPFHYKTGVYPGQFVKEIGKGAEGVVIQGTWDNEKAAFKFVQVRDQKYMEKVEDNLADMNARVREMIEMDSVTGPNILKFNGHFRQQIKFEDNEKLAKMLGMEAGEVKKFEVFVTQFCDGFIGDTNFTPDLDERKNIVTQLLNGLEQLKNASKCHNDIKPSNALYRKTNNAYSIQIADFGQCGGKGGTPGWTAPVFHQERQPGKEDMFSVGWLCLYLLCETKDLFCSLRDNYVQDVDAAWMTDFRSMTEIDFVFKLVDLDSQPTVQEVKDHWNRIISSVRMVDISRLVAIGVPRSSLRLQLERPNDQNFTVEGKLNISITDMKTITLTRVHDQGKTGLCWDYAASSSVRQSLRIKIATLPNGHEKDETLRFMGKGHQQILRKEIIFGLRPTTLKGSKNQGFKLDKFADLMILLGSGGFFRDSGLNHLPSIKHIADLLNKPNIFKNVSYKIVKTSRFLRNNANRPVTETHSPIVIVQLFSGGFHVVVLNDTKIYRDEDGYEYIKLKNSWASLPIIEVYLKKGAWKTNDNGDMFCLFEPNSDSDSDTFAPVDEETNSNCYYIEL